MSATSVLGAAGSIGAGLLQSGSAGSAGSAASAGNAAAQAQLAAAQANVNKNTSQSTAQDFATRNDALAETLPYQAYGENAEDQLNLLLGMPTITGGAINMSQNSNQYSDLWLKRSSYPGTVDGESQFLATLTPQQQAIWNSQSMNAGQDIGYQQNIAPAVDGSTSSTTNSSLPGNYNSSVLSQITGQGTPTAGQGNTQNIVSSSNPSSAFTPTSSGTAVSAIMNSPEWQLIFGQQNPNNTVQQNMANTPGYQFTQQQAITGATNQAAAQGQALSGNQLQAITTQASGLADANAQQYTNNEMSVYNSLITNLANEAGMGANIAESRANIDTGYGTALSQAYQNNSVNNDQLATSGASANMTNGENQASSQLASGNALASGFAGAIKSISSGLTS